MTVPPQDIVIQPVPGRGYLDDVFLVRHLAEDHVDGLFEDAVVQKGLRLLLYNEVDAGLGDVAFATKLMRILRYHVPHLEIVLVSSGPEKQAQFGLPEGVAMYHFEAYAKEASDAHRQVDLVVSAPGIFDHCRSKADVLGTLDLPMETPFLFIAEYGSMRQLRDDAFKGYREQIELLVDRYLDELADRQGLDPETLGYRSSTGDVVSVVDGSVTTIGHLRGALGAPRADNPLGSWITQSTLPARSAGFDTGEIGLFIEDELTPMDSGPEAVREDLINSLQDELLRQLLSHSLAPDGNTSRAALYSGYAHSAQGFFIDYIALLEHSNTRPINVVMPNARTASDTLEAIFGDALLSRLRETGIGRIEVVGNTSSEDAHVSATVERQLGEGKTLRLITRYPLPHADMRTLLMASENATMVSGDQSFSEAISALKDVMVIEPVYCQTFHLDAQLALAERVSPELRLILEFAMKFKWEDAAWAQVAEIVRSGRVRGYFERYNQLIHRDHRLNERIVSVIKRALVTASRPAIAESLEALFTEAFDAFSRFNECRLSHARMDRLRILLSGDEC